MPFSALFNVDVLEKGLEVVSVLKTRPRDRTFTQLSDVASWICTKSALAGNPEASEVLAKMLGHVYLGPGEYVLQLGAAVDTMFIVVHGSCTAPPPEPRQNIAAGPTGVHLATLGREAYQALKRRGRAGQGQYNSAKHAILAACCRRYLEVQPEHRSMQEVRELTLLLEHLKGFAKVSRELCMKLAMSCEILAVPPGGVLVEEGKKLDAMYIVLAGCVVQRSQSITGMNAEAVAQGAGSRRTGMWRKLSHSKSKKKKDARAEAALWDKAQSRWRSDATSAGAAHAGAGLSGVTAAPQYEDGQDGAQGEGSIISVGSSDSRSSSDNDADSDDGAEALGAAIGVPGVNPASLSEVLQKLNAGMQASNGAAGVTGCMGPRPGHAHHAGVPAAFAAGAAPAPSPSTRKRNKAAYSGRPLGEPPAGRYGGVVRTMRVGESFGEFRRAPTPAPATFVAELSAAAIAAAAAASSVVAMRGASVAAAAPVAAPQATPPAACLLAITNNWFREELRLGQLQQMETLLEFLGGVEPFRGMSRAQLTVLVVIARPLLVGDGTVIAREGEVVEEMYLIYKGAVPLTVVKPAATLPPLPESRATSPTPDSVQSPHEAFEMPESQEPSPSADARCSLKHCQPMRLARFLRSSSPANLSPPAIAAATAATAAAAPSVLSDAAPAASPSVDSPAAVQPPLDGSTSSRRAMEVVELGVLHRSDIVGEALLGYPSAPKAVLPVWVTFNKPPDDDDAMDAITPGTHLATATAQGDTLLLAFGRVNLLRFGKVLQTRLQAYAQCQQEALAARREAVVEAAANVVPQPLRTLVFAPPPTPPPPTPSGPPKNTRAVKYYTPGSQAIYEEVVLHKARKLASVVHRSKAELLTRIKTMSPIVAARCALLSAGYALGSQISTAVSVEASPLRSFSSSGCVGQVLGGPVRPTSDSVGNASHSMGSAGEGSGRVSFGGSGSDSGILSSTVPCRQSWGGSSVNDGAEVGATVITVDVQPPSRPGQALETNARFKHLMGVRRSLRRPLTSDASTASASSFGASSSAPPLRSDLRPAIQRTRSLSMVVVATCPGLSSALSSNTGGSSRQALAPSLHSALTAGTAATEVHKRLHLAELDVCPLTPLFEAASKRGVVRRAQSVRWTFGQDGNLHGDGCATYSALDSAEWDDNEDGCGRAISTSAPQVAIGHEITTSTHSAPQPTLSAGARLAPQLAPARVAQASPLSTASSLPLVEASNLSSSMGLPDSLQTLLDGSCDILPAAPATPRSLNIAPVSPTSAAPTSPRTLSVGKNAASMSPRVPTSPGVTSAAVFTTPPAAAAAAVKDSTLDTSATVQDNACLTPSVSSGGPRNLHVSSTSAAIINKLRLIALRPPTLQLSGHEPSEQAYGGSGSGLARPTSSVHSGGLISPISGGASDSSSFSSPTHFSPHCMLSRTYCATPGTRAALSSPGTSPTAVQPMLGMRSHSEGQGSAWVQGPTPSLLPTPQSLARASPMPPPPPEELPASSRLPLGFARYLADKQVADYYANPLDHPDAVKGKAKLGLSRSTSSPLHRRVGM